ncbi:MAG: M20/M25/M40 family metallo-hydrolase, partial [Anaerotignaceae bacterium]
EIAHMEQCIKEATQEMGATYVFNHTLAYPSFELSPNHPLIINAEQAMIEEGITPQKMVIGGGSDANILAAAGCESIIVSVGMKDVHTVNETLDMNELWKATRFLNRMLQV